MADIPEQTCENCRFFLRLGEWGQCRRNSPQPFYVRGDVFKDGYSMSHADRVADWPMVFEDWCCGDWKMQGTVNGRAANG